MVDTPYLTAQDIRDSVTGLADDTKHPDATLERFIARFEQLAENYRGVAYTPRTETVTVTAGPGPILLNHPQVTAVSAIAYDTGTAPDVESVYIDGSALNLDSAWPLGRRVTVTYTHGYTEPPPAVIDACIEFVRAEAIQQAGSQPRNASGIRDGTGWTFESTADWEKGRPTKWMVVNDALNSLPDHRIPGVA